MTAEEAEALIKKYNEGNASPEERKLVDNWFISESAKREADPVALDYIAIRDRVWGRVAAQTSARKTISLWPKISIAAAVAAILFGVWFYTFRDPGSSFSRTEGSDHYANDIAPGRNGATLTLADGRKILINDAHAGKIATQSGVKISKTADGQIIYEITDSKSRTLTYNTLSTTRGEQTQLRLPDGSLVFLNAASSLRYPASFGSLDKRRVELTGEGYFQVAKDKAHPFVVQTSKQEVEVLGTHFNINSYEDESSVRTTLLEGSVRVTTGKSRLVLKPDEQAILNSNGLKAEQVNAEDVVAWKDGLFIFEDEPLESVMRKIARWYNVEIEYRGVDKTERIGGGVSKYDNVSKVLKQLELTKSVHFKIEGRRIIAMK